MEPKKVSVITMTYNDCKHLKECVAQIMKQDYPNIEYIIVDGGSKDDTLSVIKEAEASFPGEMKWVSEPDNGLYDALNKGIAMATGDIVGIMCDKFASSDVISKMVAAIEKEGVDGVHGDVNYVNGDKIIRKWRMGEGRIQDGWMPAHPTLYLKSDVYKKFGVYRTDYRIAADYEFMIRIIYGGGIKLAYLNEVLVNMFHGEDSTSTGGLKNYIRSFMEGWRALFQNHVPFAFYITCRRTLKVLKEFI